MALYLGLDSSTQSLTAIVLEIEAGTTRIVFETSLSFDEALPAYGTRHGVLPNADPSVVHASPMMWAEALDAVLGRVAANVDVSRLAAVAGSAQQHGSVYLSAFGTRGPLLERIHLSRETTPVWMDSSTPLECREIAGAVGGDDVLAARTGSRAFERFTGPQIRKFWKTAPAQYAATSRIHLVSSFLASLLIGEHAPIDPGDGAGMNLMDLKTGTWWQPALDATAPDLRAKLPPIVPSSTIVGTLSEYWQRRHGLPPARVAAWSGDNPCSLIGTGLVREGLAAISLGTSDTIFGLMKEPRVSTDGTGHVFGSPTGAFMGITVFRNGSLARERIRDRFGMSWSGFSRALERTPPGNRGGTMLPWFEPEITPRVPAAGVRRFRLDEHDGPANVRAVVEGQMLAMKRYSAWMGVDVKTIYATGGASANRAILQVMADVFNADVYQFVVGNTAALGAALRAYHADAKNVAWDDVVRGIAEPVAASLVRPVPAHHEIYARTPINNSTTR
ncbi:MAG TPA: FGGY-family carbohydrate kinase [Vicinamibacterales bacterium]|nr:FGGY-family carbohydrate kinase [Vicinamibacterales bacterium]